MIRSVLSFLAGILLVQQLPALPDWPWLVICMIVAGYLLWRRRWLVFWCVVGFVWAVVFAIFRIEGRLPENLEGVEIRISGVITGLPTKDNKRTRFDFNPRDGVYAANNPKAASTVAEKFVNKLPSKLRLSWYYPDRPLKAGQHWQFTVKLKRGHGTMNPGGFDYERWLFTEGIGATGYVRTYPKPVLLGRDSAWRSISVIRQTIVERLSALSGGSRNFGQIKALTIGDGGGISQAQWEVFRKTGTVHLMVISGLHIGLLAGLVYLFAIKFWTRFGSIRLPPPKIAACLSIVAALFYSALAGFSVPTQRAVVMLTVAMSAIVLQRQTRPFNMLAIAGFAVLMIDPLAVLSAGFWLSFSAVGIIIYAVSGRLGKQNCFRNAVKIHIVTCAGLSPLLLLFFREFSLIAPLANLLAVPLVSLLVVPLCILTVLLLFVSPWLAGKLLSIIDLILQGLSWFLIRLADISWASVDFAPPSYWTLFFAIPAVLLLMAPAGMPARRLGLVFLLPIFFAGRERLNEGDVDLTLLDVGQGLSAVVRTSHHQLIYDTGAKYSERFDMGNSVILPFLRSENITNIDRLIVSHGDNDHIGGAESLMRGVEVGLVLTSVPEQLLDYAPEQCKAGQSWQWDGVQFTMLSPEYTFALDNDNSCVLKIQSENGAILLTGDIESVAESRLVDTCGKGLSADVLVAPHHGSNTSSTVDFLRAVQPEYVLIPAGYRNQFGHPNKRVLTRYRKIKVKWFTSADSGAIFIHVNRDGVSVNRMRETNSKYWNFK